MITNYSFKQGELIWNQTLELAIAKELGLPELKCGGQVIRDEKGWRENEKYIDYIWITTINQSFIGFCGLITIKFEASPFRGIENPESLIKCIFLCDINGKITYFYKKEELNDFQDPIATLDNLDLFNANKGITLDGISYRFHVISNNINSIINVHNPNDPTWKNWEQKIGELGKYLSLNSKNIDLIRFFE